MPKNDNRLFVGRRRRSINCHSGINCLDRSSDLDAPQAVENEKESFLSTADTSINHEMSNIGESLAYAHM